MIIVFVRLLHPYFVFVLITPHLGILYTYWHQNNILYTYWHQNNILYTYWHQNNILYTYWHQNDKDV
jgi:hypothetical protein